MSVRDLQDLLLASRGDRKRPEIARRAESVRGGDPDFDERAIEYLEHDIRQPPVNGLRFRTHCAAVGLNLLDAHTALDYWPPLGIGPQRLKLAVLLDLCKRHGIQIASQDAESRRVVLQL